MSEFLHGFIMRNRRENDRDGSLRSGKKGFEISPKNDSDEPVIQESGLRNYFTRRGCYGYLEKDEMATGFISWKMRSR